LAEVTIDSIQEALVAAGLDGWLFFDHHKRDPLAYRILDIPLDVSATRRWYYFIPAHGEPKRLVHQIESGTLDSVPGSKAVYSSWEDQQQRLSALLTGAKLIAMQYSPQCAIPYVSLVDAGTIELVKKCGVEVVSSANLVQEFEARWTEAQFQMHLEAGRRVDQARREAFDFIGERVRSGESVNEYEVQQFMCMRFAQLEVTADHGPTVAVNANASDPHYEPSSERHSPINKGDNVLIDCWAKLTQPHAVYYDIAWVGFCGDVAPAEVQNVFEVVREARVKTCLFVIEKVAARETIAGFQVDDVARGLVTERGFGDYFFHRTGHSIGEDVHGTGANMDNFECHDERKIIPGSCFSIEPGIYLPKFGIRSEVNVFVSKTSAQVTGQQQEKVVLI
jgi:Xaa-Pro aminopeptidase